MDNNDDSKSTNSSPGGENLEQKHNRLLQEYAKLRSQMTVLKNVVVEEKNQSTELKNTLRQRDQAVRRLEQETESLRFCNGQMQTRLGFLQRELQERDSRPKNGKKKNANVSDGSQADPGLSADFVQLVEINAHLTSKLNSVETELENRTIEFETQLKNAQAAESQAKVELDEFRAQYDELEKKIKMECEIARKRENTEISSRLFALQEENSQLKSSLESSKNSVEYLNKMQVDAAQHSEFTRNLNQQITIQKDQLVQLQQEKEKWMFEAQILKLKLSQTGKDSLLNDEPAPNSSSSDSPFDPETANPVRDQLKKRVNALVADLQFADGKAFYFQAECSALHLRLQLAEENKEKVDRCLVDAQNHISDLHKQLETTVIQTNEQMSLMSEHLASMNEKLQNKTDEINLLKYELQQRSQPPAKPQKSAAKR